MNTKTLASALREAGLITFSDKSSYPKPNAQANLSGRTHYADEDTLHFFRARILRCSDLAEGCLLKIIESVSADWHHTRRVFRFALFDVFGSCIYRPDLESSYTSSAAADKAFWKWYEKFDLGAHYAAELIRRAKNLRSEADRLEAAISATVEA